MADNIYIYDEKTKTRKKYSAAEIEELVADSGSEISSETSSDDEVEQNFGVNITFFKENRYYQSGFYR